MPPVVIAAAVVAGAAITSSVIGKAASASDRDAAKSASQKAYEKIMAVGAPPDLSKEIYMEEFRSAGLLTPEIEKEINVQFEKIQAPDKKTKEAQQHVLQRLTQSSQGGLTAEERVAQNKIRNNQARENEAAKNSIIQNLAQRGQAGGGAELAARLQGSQASANQASEESDRVAAAAQARALQSLGTLGNLSSNMRGQEFSENQAQTGIANEQNRFNVANAQGQQMRNVSTANQAQAGNLQNAQSIMNANIGMGNQERLRQANATRQLWQDQTEQARNQANALLGKASQHKADAAATQAEWKGYGDAIGTGAMAAAGGGAFGQMGGGSAGGSGGSGFAGSNRSDYTNLPSTYNSGGNSSDYINLRDIPPRSFENSMRKIAYNQGGVVQGYNNGGEVQSENSGANLAARMANIQQPDMAQMQALQRLQQLAQQQGQQLGQGQQINSRMMEMQQQAGQPVPETDLSQFTNQAYRGFNEGGEVKPNLDEKKVKDFTAGYLAALGHPNPVAASEAPAPKPKPKSYNHGGYVNMASGGNVPGEEVVPGDSPMNDIVPARLEAGEYVVPKADAPSMQLIHQILKGMKKK